MRASHAPRWTRTPAFRGIILAAGLGLAACAPQANPEALAGFRQNLATGQFQTAATIATQQAAPNAEGRGTELMWSLNAGAAALHGGEHNRAIAMLDGAEDLMRAREEANFDWGQTYRFGTYDAVMVNAYKAFAMLGRGDRDGARVEMNRLEERQARTAERFRQLIETERARLDAEGRQDRTRGTALAAAQDNPAVRDQLQALDTYRGYQPFVNPAGTYLRSLFLLNTGIPGDAESARNGFQRVIGVMGNPRVVAEDMELARQAAQGRRSPPQVWVIFENGQSPLFEQLNFTIPVPVAAPRGGVGVSVVTVSMPRLVFQPSAYGALEVRAGSGPGVTTTLVGSIEGVMASEFRTRYSSLLAAAVFEAVAKAVAQSAANVAAGQVGGFGGLAIQLAALAATNITQSDTRSWHALPREFQAARVPVPANGSLTVSAMGGPTQNVTVPTGQSSVVVVKAQAPGSPLTIQVYPLGGAR
ncbi:MAG: hypothetical protein K2X11_00150 [Acetobacteraceae bacterium]|nr:hypothetical protein [Acetobacteraceae bacterium]